MKNSNTSWCLIVSAATLSVVLAGCYKGGGLDVGRGRFVPGGAESTTQASAPAGSLENSPILMNPNSTARRTITGTSASGDYQYAAWAIAGVTTVGFFNGQGHSTFATVPFPSPCVAPIILTQSYNDSILCGNGSGPTPCPSNLATDSVDLHSYVNSVTSTDFKVFLSTSDGVWVGAQSPAFTIAYQVICPL